MDVLPIRNQFVSFRPVCTICMFGSTCHCWCGNLVQYRQNISNCSCFDAISYTLNISYRSWQVRCRSDLKSSFTDRGPSHHQGSNSNLNRSCVRMFSSSLAIFGEFVRSLPIFLHYFRTDQHNEN